ncbi:MAG TPA: FmdB family zinc ribbon protein [Actinomycetota bacterium]
MPTYEYACVECGNHIEVVQSMSDPPLAVCAACGGKLRKVFSPIGIVFKGSGFYRTDSRGKSSTATKETSSDGSSAKAKTSSSSDSNGSSTKSDTSSGKSTEKSA